MTRQPHRRTFLKSTALAGFGYWVAGPARAESGSANDRLNVAVIGAAGRGVENWRMIRFAGGNIVALCDVDESRIGPAVKAFPHAKRYVDFRKMLDEMNRDIDAVVVSTPDHVHAPASVMAMKMGKHVYCEKPMAHDVHEARVMRETAARYKVATQMGNQGTSGNGLRRAVEIIQSGAIGPVGEVHVWTDRPGKYWVQDRNRPAETPPVPRTLRWDLWLGPAPERAYHPIYLPRAWRGWFDFGCGALGDMGCHTMNLPFMALKLGPPTSVEARTPGVKAESFPRWAVITYEFPAREGLLPVRLTWYEGGQKPPAELFHGQKITSGGSLFVGAKGTLYSPGDYGVSHRLLPTEKFENFEGPPESLPRSPGHHKEWILACKGGKPAMSNFDYAAVLTETVLLGNVAVRAGKRIEWDAAAMRAANCPEAAPLIRREYRKGWTL